MRTILTVVLALAAASAFTVHQHSSEQHCVDLQCPATAFAYGKTSLVNEETLSSEKCNDCRQCTANGYSVCMRTRGGSPTRARRQSDSTTDGCSCAHSVPANCHNQLSETKHPANITMQLYNICYTSAIQAPPKPFASNEKDSVIVTVEPFWQEPYWRDLDLENLTLHYEYVVKVPEHCDGDVLSTESSPPVHMCNNHLRIDMATTEEKHDDDYEHSENYDQYDDDLPPEVQFDRDVFAGAKDAKIYYKVDVRRPRQLKIRANSNDPFEDLTTDVESEVVRFDLQPEVYGTGIPELTGKVEEESKEADDGVVEDPDDEDEELDESDNPLNKPGTDFFVDDGAKDTKEEQAEEKEDEELASKAAAADKESTEEEEEKTEKVEETTTVESTQTDETDESNGEKDENKVPNLDEAQNDDEKEKESEEEEEKTTVDGEDDEEKRDEEEKEESEKAEDDKDEDESEETETQAAVTEEGEETTGVEDSTTTGETESKEETTDDETEDESEETDEDAGWFANFRRDLSTDKYHLARVVFVVTIVSCLIFICSFCLYRRCCTSKQRTVKSANGHRYEAPVQQNHQLVEKEGNTSCAEDALVINTDELMHRYNSAILRFENLDQRRVDDSAIIGLGRFGAINRALHTNIGATQDVCVYRMKAINTLPPAELRSMMHLLEQTAAAGSHRNFISARGMCYRNETSLLVFEPFIDPSLQPILRESRCARFAKNQFRSASFFSPERLFTMMKEISIGAMELCQRGVIHPHLATANVLVCERGHVKISGFGLAEHFSLDARKHEKPISPLRWQSPESFSSFERTVDERSIRWSLGVLLWEIVTLGGTPYAEVRSEDDLVAKMRSKLLKLTYPSYVGSALQLLIVFCFYFDRTKRLDFPAIIKRIECLSADPTNHLNLQIDENVEEYPYAPICLHLERRTPDLLCRSIVN